MVIRSSQLHVFFGYQHFSPGLLVLLRSEVEEQGFANYMDSEGKKHRHTSLNNAANVGYHGAALFLFLFLSFGPGSCLC